VQNDETTNAVFSMALKIGGKCKQVKRQKRRGSIAGVYEAARACMAMANKVSFRLWVLSDRF
jgi:hypothetical protein